MTHDPVLMELEHNRKRLNYYHQLKRRHGPDSSVIDKWIEIYQARIENLEKSKIVSPKRGIEAPSPEKLN